MRKKNNIRFTIRILTITLLAAVLLVSTSCGSASSPKTREKGEAPQLTITAEKSKVQAIRTTYSWQEGGIGVEADGLHPLDMADDLPVLKVQKDEVVTLSFDYDIKPDQISVLLWSVAAAGSGAYGEPEYSLRVNEDQTVILPANGTYLYQVHASWKTENNVGGNAYYGFASAPAGKK